MSKYFHLNLSFNDIALIKNFRNEFKISDR